VHLPSSREVEVELAGAGRARVQLALAFDARVACPDKLRPPLHARRALARRRRIAFIDIATRGR
jgi:hypothetical protein